MKPKLDVRAETSRQKALKISLFLCVIGNWINMHLWSDSSTGMSYIKITYMTEWIYCILIGPNINIPERFSKFLLWISIAVHKISLLTEPVYVLWFKRTDICTTRIDFRLRRYGTGNCVAL